jgi:hypothetical protein
MVLMGVVILKGIKDKWGNHFDRFVGRNCVKAEKFVEYA